MKEYIGNASIENYSDCLKYKMSKDDNRKLFKEWYEDNDKSAREKLITGNLRLVLSIANTKIPMDQAYDQDDLFHVGIIGLIRAVDTYDYKSPYEFSTYAAKIISNELNMLWRKWKYATQIYSLNDIVLGKDNAYTEFLELIPDEHDFTEDIFHQTQLMLIDQMLDVLTERERLVLCKKFGLRGYKKTIQTEIGRELGYTQSYISKLSRDAINKIRDKWLDKL